MDMLIDSEEPVVNPPIIGPHGRHLFSLIDDNSLCDCEKGGDGSHLVIVGARWPVPFESHDLDGRLPFTL